MGGRRPRDHAAVGRQGARYGRREAIGSADMTPTRASTYDHFSMEFSNCMFGRVYSSGTRGIFGRHTELTEVSSPGIEVVPNLPKCRAPELKSYRTYRSVGYQYRVRTELNRSVR